MTRVSRQTANAATLEMRRAYALTAQDALRAAGIAAVVGPSDYDQTVCLFRRGNGGVSVAALRGYPDTGGARVVRASVGALRPRMDLEPDDYVCRCLRIPEWVGLRGYPWRQEIPAPDESWEMTLAPGEVALVTPWLIDRLVTPDQPDVLARCPLALRDGASPRYAWSVLAWGMHEAGR